MPSYTDTLKIVQWQNQAIGTTGVWVYEGGTYSPVAPCRLQIVDWGFACVAGGVFTGNLQIAFQVAPSVSSGAVFSTVATMSAANIPNKTFVAGTRYLSTAIRTNPATILPGGSFQINTLTASATGVATLFPFAIIWVSGFVGISPVTGGQNLASPIVQVGS